MRSLRLGCYNCGPGGGLANIDACYLECDLCMGNVDCPTGMECVTAGDFCPLMGRCLWPLD